MSGDAGRGGRFTLLEAGRGVAACMVVAHHAMLLVAEPRYLNAVAWLGAPLFFNAGVDFFFVLSGFIIPYVHWGDVGRTGRLGRYALLRTTRIYPLYWLVLAPMLFAYWRWPGLGEARQHDLGYALGSVLLAPMPVQPVLGAAWTLTYELMFYALFGVVIVSGGRVARLGGVIWAALVLAAAAFGGAGFPAGFLTDPHDLEFLMGALVAARLRGGAPVPAPRLWLAGGLAAFVLEVLAGEPHLGLTAPLVQALILGGGSAAAIAGAAALEREGRLAAPRGWVSLGAASYAIYLAHVPAQSLMVRLWLRLGLRQPDLLVAAVVLGGVAAGFALHWAVERPLQRRLRAWLRPAPAVAPAPAPA